MKHARFLLLSFLGIAIGIIIWFFGLYCCLQGTIYHGLDFARPMYEYTAGYYVGLGLVLAGVILVFIALRAATYVPSAVPRVVLGDGIGFLIFSALKSQWPLATLILGGLVSGLMAWSGIRRGMYAGLVSRILCSALESSFYVSAFLIDPVVVGLNLAVAIEMSIFVRLPITVVMAICGALGAIPSSPTAFYLIPGRGE